MTCSILEANKLFEKSLLGLVHKRPYQFSYHLKTENNVGWFNFKAYKKSLFQRGQIMWSDHSTPPLFGVFIVLVILFRFSWKHSVLSTVALGVRSLHVVLRSASRVIKYSLRRCWKLQYNLVCTCRFCKLYCKKWLLFASYSLLLMIQVVSVSLISPQS